MLLGKQLIYSYLAVTFSIQIKSGSKSFSVDLNPDFLHNLIKPLRLTAGLVAINLKAQTSVYNIILS
ncbi:hypothetical protein K413DRAFT_1040 [Clostridium sp. ASBs410]|nr:hypothetical protein K413DRAFT_1040 [Clostridium sp. ASBs410]